MAACENLSESVMISEAVRESRSVAESTSLYWMTEEELQPRFHAASGALAVARYGYRAAFSQYFSSLRNGSTPH